MPCVNLDFFPQSMDPERVRLQQCFDLELVGRANDP